MKPTCLMILLFAACSFNACKKDQLMVNEEKTFVEVDFKVEDPMFGPWRLTLKPDGIADVLPGGDINYRGTYKINGSGIKVKTEQNNETYAFDILSEAEIKEKQYGTVLRLR